MRGESNPQQPMSKLTCTAAYLLCPEIRSTRRAARVPCAAQRAHVEQTLSWLRRAWQGGLFHGRILLPPEYPFKPPSFMMQTVGQPSPPDRASVQSGLSTTRTHASRRLSADGGGGARSPTGGSRLE
jgi:hypothetical protein